MMNLPKLGSVLPSMSRKRMPFSAKAEPFKGKTTDWDYPSDDERLELFAQKSETALGTLPERIVQVWLEQRNYQFIPQYTVSGAGARLDFLVIVGVPPGVAVRVMGNYFHTLEGRMASDASQSLRLIAMGYRVCDLWELDCYSHVLSGDFFTWADEQLFLAA